MQLRFKKLDSKAIVPASAHSGDAGFDLCSIEEAVVDPGKRLRVRTGIAVAIPDGFAGLVLPRSGLADRHGIALVNSPGLIDAGYRGELQVLLLNTDGSEPFSIAPGDRIAQLVVVGFAAPDWHEVDEFDSTDRGDNGFGSTGV